MTVRAARRDVPGDPLLPDDPRDVTPAQCNVRRARRNA